MTYEENIRAILECCFAGFKDEIIDSACYRILEQEPCEDADTAQSQKRISFDGHEKGDWVVESHGLYKIESVEDDGGYTSELYIPRDVFVECYNKWIRGDRVGNGADENINRQIRREPQKTDKQTQLDMLRRLKNNEPIWGLYWDKKSAHVFNNYDIRYEEGGWKIMMTMGHGDFDWYTPEEYGITWAFTLAELKGKTESEGGDYADLGFPDQFDNMTGSMNL